MNNEINVKGHESEKNALKYNKIMLINGRGTANSINIPLFIFAEGDQQNLKPESMIVLFFLVEESKH